MKRTHSGVRSAWLRAVPTALLLCAAFARPAPASAVEREAAIVSRALAFERSLDERVGDRPIGIAVIHKAEDANSERCARDWREGFAALSNVKIRDRSVTLKVVPYSPDALAKLRANEIAVFVVCSGLSQEASEITRVSRAQRILTVGTVLSYVEQSMTFGVFPEAGKYRMVVNLRAGAAERITFSSSMLKLARVLR